MYQHLVHQFGPTLRAFAFEADDWRLMPMARFIEKVTSPIEAVRFAKWKLIGYSVAVVLVSVVLAISFLFSRTSKVTIDAETRGFKVEFYADDPLPLWSNLPVRITTTESENAKSICSEGVFTFQPVNKSGRPLTLIFFRADSGEIYASIKNTSLSLSVDAFTLNCSTIAQQVPNNFSIVIPLSSTPVPKKWALSINGRLDLGESAVSLVGQEGASSGMNGSNVQQALTRSERMIISGKVISEVVSLPFPSSIIKTETTLWPGDRLIVGGGVGGDEAVPLALTITSSHDAIRLLGHGAGNQLVINRPGNRSGSSEVGLVPATWSRFKAQEEWLIILTFFFLLKGLISSLETFNRERYQSNRT
jgi:hypothetical protein